ncbi:TIGR00645 family protein [Streptomyces yaizuensis]|uniref:UPF0114 protein SYYSPA8_16270 n=1 Tax=Streptomyces yaizuensis TaxID=2989713 RepID=A0ABQ5P0A6_9ACTN|nr:TIGR00645 family protein [Streptomyces sp. YSPA8]GLF95873.1 TIGR00645 family protein [Streptomyces sp. YSPA8]
MPLLGHPLPSSSKPGIASYAAPSLGYALFATRWLQAPLYFGLVAAQGVYVYKFFNELWHLVAHIISGHVNETHVMLAVLKLVDVVMIANLLIMVIVGGYETFVSRIGLQGHRDQPEWLSHVNSNVLKVKLATAIVGISSVHLLQMFVDVDHTEQHSLLWGTVIHMAFILSAAILAYMSGPMESRNYQPPGPGGGTRAPRPPRPSSPTQLIISERALPEGLTGSMTLRDLLPAQSTGEPRPAADGVIVQDRNPVVNTAKAGHAGSAGVSGDGEGTGTRVTDPARAAGPGAYVPHQQSYQQSHQQSYEQYPRYPERAEYGGYGDHGHHPERPERRGTAAENRIRAAGFPVRTSLEEFDTHDGSQPDRETVDRLGRLDFLRGRGNAVLVGPPGTGRTRLAAGIGLRACQAGHEVRFATAAEWVARLTTAHADGRLTEELAGLDRYALIVVDGIEYVPGDPEATNLLFRLVSHRYERGSVVVTGDRAPGYWGEILGTGPVTSALVDRVTHHAEVVTLRGDGRALVAGPDLL